MTKVWILLITFIMLAAIGALIFFWQKGSLSKTPPVIPIPTVQSSPNFTSETNIKAAKPLPNERLSLPIIIQGEARVFENQFNYRVRDEAGTIIAEGTAQTDSQEMGLFGKFVITINSFSEPKGMKGTIEIFDYSAKDGSEIDKVTIPVLFDKEKNTTIRAYFGSNQQPGGLVCDQVFPVFRSIIKTKTPARASIEELLKGPTGAEKLEGYFTNINEGVKIQKLTIENGVARVDIDKKLEEDMGGSCKVTAIRAQIVQTLKQFPTVSEVVISIDGRTEDILQP